MGDHAVKEPKKAETFEHQARAAATDEINKYGKTLVDESVRMTVNLAVQRLVTEKKEGHTVTIEDVREKVNKILVAQKPERKPPAISKSEAIAAAMEESETGTGMLIPFSGTRKKDAAEIISGKMEEARRKIAMLERFIGTGSAETRIKDLKNREGKGADIAEDREALGGIARAYDEVNALIDELGKKVRDTAMITELKGRYNKELEALKESRDALTPSMGRISEYLQTPPAAKGA